jgi:predicted nucleotidyltransferase
MLSAAEQQVLTAFKAALIARFGDRLARLSLFGSRARGGGRDDSDLDLLVEVRDVTADERIDIVDLAADLSVEHGLVLSPLVPRQGAGRLCESIVRDAVTL